MKKRLLSLLLTLCLAAALAVPASAAGGYGPLTLQLEGGRSVTFSAAVMEQKTVQVAHYNAANVLSAYSGTTVNLVKLQPGSSVTVQNGIRDYDGYGVPGSGGEYHNDSRFVTFYAGAAQISIFQGKAEDSFDQHYSMRSIYGPAPAYEPYFVVMGPSVGSSGFSDVADSDYFAQPVKWAVGKGITNGTGAMTFGPKSSCTTAQILTFLYRANGSPSVSASNPFADVAPSDYYYASARWAGEKGLGTGRSLNASTGCTRGNVVTYLWKLAGSPAASGGAFTDVAAGSDLAKAVAWAVSQGLTNGTTSTTFSPDKVCTRGEIVTFLYRAYGA